MFKKLALTALAVLAGLFILNNTRLGSYGQTAWGKIKHTAKTQVPLEFELERVKQQVGMLLPDVNKHLGCVAEEMVAVDNLKEEIKVARTNLARDTERVRTMAEELKSGAERISFTGRVYTRARFSEKLSQDVIACKGLAKEIEAREQLLEHKERALESTREQLTSIKAQRQELEVEVARLEAELKSVRLAQTKSKIQVDDSRLAHIKSSLADIRNRLKVDKVTTDLTNQFAGEQEIAITRPSKTTADALKEAEAFLNGTANDRAIADNKE